MKIVSPTTPGQRGMRKIDYSIITKKNPEKSLSVKLKTRSGRNNQGRITVRHQGNGEKKLYRVISRQPKFDVPAKVIAIEYDPYRTAFLVLLQFADGEKRYGIAWKGAAVGQTVVNSEKAALQDGNRMQLKNIPVGYPIFDLELYPGQKGRIVRSAGSAAHILAKEGTMITVELPSKEVRLFKDNCYATMGMVSNEEHRYEIVGKAGKSRHRGVRPAVRGTVMNPVDHPHGGGEGKQPIGLKHPKTPWGKPALGKKTRNPKKWSNKYIVRRRNAK